MFEIANRIARVSLLHPLDFSSSQLSTEDYDLMTSSQYHQLLRYRQQSAAAVLEPIQSLKWLQPLDIPGVKPQPPCTCSASSRVYKAIRDPPTYALRWVSLYLERCEATLRSRPHSDTVLDDSIILPSILDAARYSVCRSSANELRLFSRKLEKEFRSALDTVRNDMCLTLRAFSDANNMCSGAPTLSSGRAVEEGIKDFLYK